MLFVVQSSNSIESYRHTHEIFLYHYESLLTWPFRCAQKDECKGKWLQSRKVDACLTGNMSGVVAHQSNQILLCHYCCESSGNMPCNLQSRPAQIEQFIQPTTTTIKPTTISTTMPTTMPTTLPTTIPATLATTMPTTIPTTLPTTITTLPTTTSKYCKIT